MIHWQPDFWFRGLAVWLPKEILSCGSVVWIRDMACANGDGLMKKAVSNGIKYLSCNLARTILDIYIMATAHPAPVFSFDLPTHSSAEAGAAQ